MASDAGHKLCNMLELGELDGFPIPQTSAQAFAATYYDKHNFRCFSLRSHSSGGADVSQIATQYGGGGHKNAAGFTVKLDHPLAKA